MTDLNYRIEDLGDRRVLTLEGKTYPPTRYSKRVIEMLIERKQERAPLYFRFKEHRAPFYLDPLLRWLRARGARNLSVLEVGCSFRHMTEYLNEQPEIGTITTFDVDEHFVKIVRTKVEEMGLNKVSVELLSNESSRHLPWRDGAFDLVLAIGVIEHLPWDRRALVDEYYRVLAVGGHIAILDTPNRYFPWESHSIGFLGVQWMSPWWAYQSYRLKCFYEGTTPASYDVFTADGTGWRNATWAQCLPTSGLRGLTDITEPAGYGWQFFRDEARRRPHSMKRRALVRLLGPCVSALRARGYSPSLCLPYLNLLFRRDAAAAQSP